MSADPVPGDRANVRQMASEKRGDLDKLYEDLARFAPQVRAGELAELAERLSELRRHDREREDLPIEAIWKRVVDSIDDPSVPG